MSANDEKGPYVNRCRHHGPDSESLDDLHPVFGDEGACDAPFSGLIDMTPFEEDFGTATTAGPDPAMLQLRGLMVGLGLIARPLP